MRWQIPPWGNIIYGDMVAILNCVLAACVVVAIAGMLGLRIVFAERDRVRVELQPWLRRRRRPRAW